MSNRLLAVSVAALALAASPARADSDERRLEVAPFVGAWIPIGQARGDFGGAPLTGLQLAYGFHPNVAVVGTLSWASSEARRLGGAHLDVLQYDLGLRGQHSFALGRGATLRPFLGLGVGQCRFDVRNLDDAGGPGFAFYSSAGVEAGYRAVAAGLTFRHQTQSFEASTLDIGAPRQNLELFTSVGLRF